MTGSCRRLEVAWKGVKECQRPVRHFDRGWLSGLFLQGEGLSAPELIL
jgi:hypothetical protein